MGGIPGDVTEGALYGQIHTDFCEVPSFYFDCWDLIANWLQTSIPMMKVCHEPKIIIDLVPWPSIVTLSSLLTWTMNPSAKLRC